MTRRSYGQYCTLASALDVVGERWTLLIVRELMIGPRRFTDLLANLPGIGKNLLTERLRLLEDEGVLLRRRLPPPADSRVYELTADGRALGPALAELGRWGLGRVGSPHPDRAFRAAWAMFPMSYMADTEAARGVQETYEFRVDEETFHLRVHDGRVTPRAGEAVDPDLVITMDLSTLLELFSGELAALDAVTGGRLAIEGSPGALQNSLAIIAAEPQTARAEAAER